jgi:uncharacterized membrane protein
MDVLSTIHKYLGETMLLVAFIGVVLALVALVRKREMGRTERIFGSAYAGLLDLQALLGVILFVWLLTLGATGLATSTFILHPILMVMAVVVVHASRIWRDNPPPKGHYAQLIAYGLSLVLIFAGRMVA